MIVSVSSPPDRIRPNLIDASTIIPFVMSMRARLIVFESRPLECAHACHLDCFRTIATDVHSRRHGKRT